MNKSSWFEYRKKTCSWYFEIDEVGHVLKVIKDGIGMLYSKEYDDFILMYENELKLLSQIKSTSILIFSKTQYMCDAIDRFNDILEIIDIFR